jgi:hypothetical protein
VQAAGLAPSVHNTQPWRFVSRPGTLEIHADPTRQLEVLDPDSRQLHLSCGAALHHARVAARALGLDADVSLLPDPSRPTHLADLVLTEGRSATEDEVRMATAMLRRHTHRGPFDSAALPPSLLDLLSTAARSEGARLMHVRSEDHLIALEVLLSQADELEQHDPRYREELQRWVRHGNTDADGVPDSAASVVAGSSLRQRDFTLTSPASLDGSASAAEHPVVVVLTTDDDDPVAWLQAGQALAAVLLHAAEHGVQTQPLGQVTDIVAYRLGLRGALGILGVPQLVLRMGYARRTAATPRRPVEDILTAVAD